MFCVGGQIGVIGMEHCQGFIESFGEGNSVGESFETGLGAVQQEQNFVSCPGGLLKDG